MSQKGDPILSMTKMFLRGTQILLSDQQPTQTSRTPHSVCVTTLTSETDRSTSQSLARPVNRYERTEIDALIFYATRKLGDSADNIILRMLQDLGDISFDELSLTDYLTIRAYMWKTLANAG